MSVGLKPTLRGIYVEGDTVVIFFDARGAARDDSPTKHVCWLLAPREDKAVKAFRFFDRVVFKRLLGAREAVAGNRFSGDACVHERG